MARRSIVLLKNDPVQGETLLPLKNGLKLAVIGPQATAIYGSDGPSVSLLQGLTERAPQSQVQLLVAQGAQLLMVDGKDTSSIGKAFLNEAVRIASQADVLLLALGEPESWSGEAASRTRIGLPLNQQVLFRAMSELGKPIILVLSNGRPLAISEESQSSQAILETWFLGTESGHAIADVLFGDTNPSGKLTMTFPVDEGQIPIFYSELPTGRPDDPHDSFSSKYLDAPNTPLFPFGWGLSYSHFSYSNLHLKTTRLRPDAIQKVFVTVTNTGKYAGEETVQLYIHRLVAPVSQPVQLLRGFQKVFLKPGESREVSLPLKLEDLKYVDEQLRSVATPGDFTVMIGGNSAEVLSTQMTLLGR
jgi:beta-glucosidase